MTLPRARGVRRGDPRRFHRSARGVPMPALSPTHRGASAQAALQRTRPSAVDALTRGLRISIPAAQFRPAPSIASDADMRVYLQLKILGASTALLAAGCATLVSGRHADVAIHSNPSDAHVTVRDRRGRTVAEATTPAVVPLKRGDGFFRKARYTATIEKPGYASAQVAIDSKLNPWVAGNLAFGGLVGLAVDPYTGAMWKPNPNEVQLDLLPLGRPEIAQASLIVPAIDPATPEQIK